MIFFKKYASMVMMRSFLSVLFIFLLCTQPVLAMSSSNYQINWDSVNTGGDDVAASTNYTLHDTIGGVAIGNSTSELYSLQAGYRVAEASTDALSLSVGAQETATQVTYSDFQALAGTVTVSSAGYLSVGDYVSVVEHEGFSQLIAIGRVASISSNVVTVDSWSGDQAAMSVTPSGSTNFVYRMNGASLAFGTVTAGSEHVATAALLAVSTAANGYSVYIQGDGGLRASSAAISPVLDGAVSVGSEEYGVSVTGTHAFGAGQDVAVTSTQRVIQESSTLSAAIGDRLGMVFKLSTTAATTPGSYTQTVYYTLTANY